MAGKAKDEPEGTTPPEDKPGTAPAAVGGPGVGADAPATPKLVPVKYGDKEYQLPEEAAAAWQDREKAFSRKLSETSDELGGLRQFHQRYSPVVQQFQQPKPQEPDINTLWFENPAKAAEMIEQRATEKANAEYRRDRALQEFWDGMWTDHPDLKTDAWVVRAVANEHFGELANLKVAEARDKLADLSRRRILDIGKRTRQNGAATSPHLAEPASGERTPRPDREEPEGHSSIGAILKAKREARRAAKYKVGAKG